MTISSEQYYKEGHSINMAHPVIVTSDAIRCPHCKQRVRLIQHKAVGAVYSRKWRSLNVQRCMFLSMWLKSDFYNSYVTKNMLHKRLLKEIKKQKLYGFIKPINFAARVSELVAAGTDYNAALVLKDTTLVSNSGDKMRGPFYKLDGRRVKSVLKKGGKLD